MERLRFDRPWRRRMRTLALAAVTTLALGGGIVAPAAAYAAETPLATPNVNHVLKATVTASTTEAESRAAKFAQDGDKTTWWSSGESVPAADVYLRAQFGSTTTVKQLSVTFENRSVPVKPSNIESFDVKYADASGAEHLVKSVKNTASGDGFSTDVTVVLDTPVDATWVELTNFKAKAGSTQWNGAGVAELEAYSNVQVDALDTPDVNHARTATLQASGQEAASLSPDKAADGNDTTRWSSGAVKPDAGVYLQASFGQVTKISQLDITFETRTVAVQPGNVKAFDIQYQANEGGPWTTVQRVANTQDGSGYATHVRADLATPIAAKAIRLTNFDIATDPAQTQWNGVSVVELEAYSNVRASGASLKEVVAGLRGTTIERDQKALPLPQVPDGFTVKLNGADFEQIIGDDLTVVHPLEDKTVKVSWTVTQDATKESLTSADLEYTVRGTRDAAQNANAKPKIIPEIQEWHATDTAKLAAKDITRVTYSDAALKAVVDEFVADYRDFTGIKLTASQGAAVDGAFNFTLGAPAEDKLLGDEGYTMAIGAKRIDVQSQAVVGNMYGMQTILQMSRQDATGFPQGQMRDYPRFRVRGFMWDVARKPISLEMMKTAARTMRYYKMNDFQTHLSDNYIFLEHYTTEAEAWKAYSAFRLETDVANAKGETPTAKDYAISKDEFRSFIQSERARGMNIVPEIDMPAHAVAFTKVWPELGVTGKSLTTNGKRHAIDHFDLTKPEATKKIEEIFDDYTGGATPTFDKDTVVHVGADEFLIAGGNETYRSFVNDLIPHVKQTNTVRMWGGLSWLSGSTQIKPEAIDGVQMNLWSRDWADGQAMYDMGYDLINTIDTYGYMVPNGGGSRGAYGDYLNTTAIFNEFAPERVSTKQGWRNLPSGDDQVLGSAFAIWNDNIDKSASGLSEADEYARFFDALPFYAEKNWAATGKEKGSADALSKLAAQQGDAPRTNPYSKASRTGDAYASYDFEKGLADTSGNDRALTAGAGSTVADGALKLTGGASYVSSPLDKIAAGTTLSFDIELTRAACPGDILFEADAPYGTLDIRVMDDGRLGFTRELYDYYFDYKLPVGKQVNIQITTGAQATTLTVDGVVQGKATGRFVDQGLVKKDGIPNATLTLPLARIGSKTHGIAATIDNVSVKPADTSTRDEFNKKGWTGKTNSWTADATGTATEGELRYAWDNNPKTHWHSNWRAVTADNKDGQLTATNPIWAEIDFGKGYTINQFSFTPRTDTASGYVTRANLYLRTAKDGAWQQVAKDVAFKADGSQKTIRFDEQTVYGVKFEVTDSAAANGKKWVAVSEFDIADAPVQMSTVYAAGVSYQAADDGSLDMASGKAGGTVTGTAEDADAAASVYRADVERGSSVTLTAKPAANMEFVGWFAPCAAEPLSREASYTVDASYSVAVEARFKRGAETPEPPEPARKHTVTFVVDGNVYTSTEISDGATTAAPTDPVKDGYAFTGWFQGDTAFDFATPITGDITLEARFKKNDDGQGPTDPEQPDNKPGEPGGDQGNGGSTGGNTGGSTPGGSTGGSTKPGGGTSSGTGHASGTKPAGTKKPSAALPRTGDASFLATVAVSAGAVATLVGGALVARRRRA